MLVKHLRKEFYELLFGKVSKSAGHKNNNKKPNVFIEQIQTQLMIANAGYDILVLSILL